MYTVKEFEELVADTVYKKVSEELTNGGVIPSVYIIATVNPITEKPLNSTAVAVLKDNSDFEEEDKDRFKSLAEEVASKSCAVALVFVSEAFFVTRNIKDMDKIGKVGDHPDRKEAVMFSLEHLSYGPTSKLWMSEITTIDGKKTMGPIDKRLSEEGMSSGRFVGILKHPTKELSA